MKNDINCALEKILPTVISNVEDDYKNVIEKYYKMYFVDSYGSLFNENKNINVERIISLEINSWKNRTSNEKKFLLIPDKALQEILSISNSAMSKAIDRIQNNVIITEDEFNSCYSKLYDNLKEVLEFNKEVAEVNLADAELDLKFAAGLSDVTSIRVGSYKR